MQIDGSPNSWLARQILKIAGRVGLYPVADLALRGSVSRMGAREVYASGGTIKTDLEDYTGRRIWAESFEQRECLFIRRSLPSGGCAVDVGANIGFITLTMAFAVGRKGSVLSVEPVPSTFELLQDTLDRNGLEWVHPVQAAVGASNARIRLVKVESRSGDASHGFYRWDEQSDPAVIDEDAGQSFIVEQQTLQYLLDRECGEDAVVDLLKVDTEGMEHAVLSGMGSRLNPASVRCVLFETTVGPRGFTPESRRVFDLLESHGYEIATLDRKGGVRRVRRLRGIKRPVLTTLNLVAVDPPYSDATSVPQYA